MKGVIKNITDVITNSSSEVFVMNEDNAKEYLATENAYDCISIEKITWEWIEEDGRYEYEMISYLCDLDISIMASDEFFKNTDENRKKYYLNEWYGYPKKEDWLTFIEMHRNIIEEKLVGEYWVDIEDHFEDAYNVIESARDDSMWSDNRH